MKQNLIKLKALKIQFKKKQRNNYATNYTVTDLDKGKLFNNNIIHTSNQNFYHIISEN